MRLVLSSLNARIRVLIDIFGQLESYIWMHAIYRIFSPRIFEESWVLKSIFNKYDYGTKKGTPRNNNNAGKKHDFEFII